MKKLLFIIIFSVLLTAPCRAEPYDEKELTASLPDYAEELAGDTNSSPQAALDGVAEAFTEELGSGIGGAVKRALGIVAVALICAVLTVFCNDSPEYVQLGGCAAVTLLSVGEVNSFISSGASVITAISGFSKTLLPAMCAAGAACGTLGSASVKYAASVLFMDAFITLAQGVILPLIYACLGVGIAAAAFNNKSLEAVSKTLKRVCSFLMISCALIFTIYITISSAVASGGDAVASKLAKTAISAALPVVGGIISDAAGTVVAGAQAMRNTLGVFGMTALLAICAAPFAALGLNYLTYKLSAAAVKMFGCDRLSALADSIGSAIGMILGLAGCCAIILFVSMATSIKAVSGL